MSYSEQPNINYIKEIANGDKAFETQLIAIIKKEFPVEANDFQQNFNNKNYKLTAENVHKLKHKINIFGLERGYSIATDFEKELKANSFSKYESFKQILHIIENYIKTL